MKLLLDTHGFIWLDSNPAMLSAPAAAAIQDPANEVYFSVGSAWEMIIKSQAGKLTLRLPLEQIIPDQQRINRLQILTISLDHVLAISHLPPVHKDPFDRLLAVQANIEQARLVSSDPIFQQYPVTILW